LGHEHACEGERGPAASPPTPEGRADDRHRGFVPIAAMSKRSKVRLCNRNLLDHLVCTKQDRGRDGET
jgi:hypothetical protein